jgi:hypothetical protein
MSKQKYVQENHVRYRGLLGSFPRSRGRPTGYCQPGLRHSQRGILSQLPIPPHRRNVGVQSQQRFRHHHWWVWTDYTAPAMPPGATQAGFIQTTGPNAGTISQTASGFLAGQNYTITFYAAGRPAGAGCFDNCTELNFSVLVGQTDVLDVVNPPTNAFQQYTTKPFTASGDVTITFQATNPTSTDETSFITLVSIQGGSGTPPPAGPVIQNPAFAAPSVGSCPNFQFDPAGATWVFTTSNDAGITTGGCGGLYHAPALPSGATQAGFIQSNLNVTGSVSQTVSGFVEGHSYTITFYAAGRPDGAGCADNCTELNFSVFVNKTDVLDVVNPPTSAFQQYTTDPFTASGGVHHVCRHCSGHP